MKHLFLLFLILFPTIVWADANSNSSQLLIQEQNGTNAGRYRVLKVTNGTTTNNGDGSISVTTGGGSGSGITFTDGVNTVASATQLTVSGGTVGGSTPNATLTVTGSGSNYWNLSPGNFGINTTNNVGIGTVNPTQKLDVSGNIAILNNGSFTTKGSFQGINTIDEIWPPSGSGAVIDIASAVPNHGNQLAITSNGPSQPSAMSLWNGAIQNGATLHVTGVTTAPAHNATYTNGTCTQTVYSSDLSGTAGALAGLVATRTNCTLAASGTLTKTGGVGDSSLTYGSISWEHNWNDMIGVTAGFSGAGDEGHPELNDDGFTNPQFAIGYGVIARDTPQDTGFHMVCGFHAPFSSGCGFFADVMNDNGTPSDRVGTFFGNVQKGVPSEFDSGYSGILYNGSSTNPKGFLIASPSFVSTTNGGNIAGIIMDSINQGISFPWATSDVFTPENTSWIATVSGITTAPAVSSNVAPQYTVSGCNYDWMANNLTGVAPSISGTITFTTKCGAPPSSGTLTKNSTDGIPIGAGDSTIAYSSVVQENSYRNTMFVDTDHGNVGIGTYFGTAYGSKPGMKLDVQGTVRAFSLIATGISGSTQCLQADSTGKITGTGSSCGGSGSSPGGNTNAVQYNNASSFAGDETKFSFNGTNVGIGTSNATLGILDVRNGNVGIGTLFGINDGGANLIRAVPSATSYFMGANAGSFGITGAGAICEGSNACSSITSGGALTCIGGNACQNLTTGANIVAIGTNALQTLAANSAGDFVAIGSNALNKFSNTNNGDMVGIGNGALANVTNGSGDYCIGKNCMGTTTSIGGFSSCMGSGCLLNANSSSEWLVSLGDSAGGSVTSGHDDTFIGALSGTTTVTNAHDVLVLGGHVDANTNTSNTFNIANVLYGTGTVEGSAPSATGNVGIGTAQPRNALDVIGTSQMTGFKLTTSPTNNYVLTSDSSGTGTWQPASGGTSSQWVTGNVGIGTTSNVGIGTLQPSGLLTVGSGTTTGRILSVTGTNSGSNAHFIQGDIDDKDSTSATDTIDFDVHGGMITYSNINELTSNNMKYCMNCSTLGNDILSVGGGVDIGVWSGGQTHSAQSNGLVVSTNVGIGTWIPTGILDIGNRTTTGREFSLTGTNDTGTLHLTRGDPDGFDSGDYIDEDYDGGVATYQGMTISIQGGGNLNVGAGSQLSPVMLDGGVSIGPFAGSVDKQAPSNGLIVSGNVGLGTFKPSTQVELGAQKLNVTTAGNVGIGSVAPQSLLDVNGNIRSSALSASSNVCTDGSKNLTTSGCTGGTGSNYWNLSAGNIGINTTNNVGIGTTFTTTAALTVMSGNVGIGTWIPAAALDIPGTGNAYFGGNVGIGTLNPTSQFQIVGSGNTFIGNNVGIGSLSPGQALDVQGNIRIKLGSTLAIGTGSNACKGQATLASGTVTVSTTCTPSSSEGIFLTDATTGTLANVGSQTVGTITGGTSFVINSTNVLDSSKVNWVILTSS